MWTKNEYEFAAVRTISGCTNVAHISVNNLGMPVEKNRDEMFPFRGIRTSIVNVPSEICYFRDRWHSVTKIGHIFFPRLLRNQVYEPFPYVSEKLIE